MAKKFIDAAAGFILALILVALPSVSVNTKPVDEWQVMLPSQLDAMNTGLISVSKTANKSEWYEFKKLNGNWQFSLDKVTGSPRMAFGEPIAINGFENIERDNIEAAALSFLKNNEKLFNINTGDLKLSRKDFVNGKWYVSFRQYYKGIEVLLAGVELRINSRGKVFSFDIEYYNNLNVDIKPVISPSVAMEYASSGIETKSKLNKTMASTKTFILPVKYSDRAEFKLVYKVNVSADGKKASYTAYVDAHKGDVAWRFDNTMKATDFSVKGVIKATSPNDKPTTEPMPNIYVKVGTETYKANDKGVISCNLTGAADVSATLEGPWAKVITGGIDRGGYSGKFTPGNDFGILFDDKNTHRYERNMYYYVNNIHKFLTNLDPQLKCMDTQMVVKINFVPDPIFGNSPNAYSDGDTIVFVSCQNQIARMADGPSVLYHEYGHSVNTLFYTIRGREDGMVNMSCHEALADLTSAAILDEPEVGIGVFTDDTLKYIRNLKNNLIYPDSISGEPHHDSQILSGAMWDLREKTSLELLRKLHHYARYGLPDDPNTGLAFYKWLLEVLIADDDDGSLANKTPHYNEIIESFNNHNIGATLIYLSNFNHIPLEDTPNTSDAYKVEFSFGDDTQTLVDPDSAIVIYSVKYNNEMAGEFTVPAFRVQSKGLNYEALIPPQKKFSEVFYTIRLYFSNPKNTLSYGNNSTTVPFDFLVGYKTSHFDAFETNNNWSTFTEGDNATAGKWGMGKPFEIRIGSIGILKPAQDHSKEGQMYFSTGLNSIPQGSEDDPFAIFQYMIPNGITTLTSTDYDISALKNPILKYYIYFRQFVTGYNDGTFIPKLEVQISNDGGNNWVTVSYDTSNGIANWIKVKFRFGDFLNPTDKCRIRFRYHSKPGFNGYYPAALSSVTIDDFEILTANDGNTSVVAESADMSAVSVYPNPFGNSVLISFPATAGFPSRIKIYNLQGEEVFTKDIPTNVSDKYIFEWNGMNRNNESVMPGVYIIKINTGEKVLACKLIKQ